MDDITRLAFMDMSRLNPGLECVIDKLLVLKDRGKLKNLELVGPVKNPVYITGIYNRYVISIKNSRSGQYDDQNAVNGIVINLENLTSFAKKDLKTQIAISVWVDYPELTPVNSVRKYFANLSDNLSSRSPKSRRYTLQPVFSLQGYEASMRDRDLKIAAVNLATYLGIAPRTRVF